ncbi:unnamed protein product, partial [Symbiodinium necroappetens]
CMLKIIGDNKHPAPMAVEFVRKLQAFHQASQAAAMPDALQQACQLLNDLQGVCENLDGGDFGPPARELLQRLEKVIDAKGKQWVQRLITEKGGEAAACVAREVLKTPTPFLDGCIGTIAMTYDASAQNIDEVDTTAAAESFTALAALMPLFAKLCSVQQEFLPPEKVTSCDRFVTKITAVMAELLGGFNNSIGQLKQLAEKYRPVRGAAAKWEMEPVKWMFTGDSDVDADTQIMLELRSELIEMCKGAEKVIAIGTGARIAEPFKALCDQATALCKDMKDLRQDVALSVGTMMAADVLLNPKHTNPKATIEKSMRFVTSTLGVTHADLENISPKLTSQLAQFKDEPSDKKRAKPAEPKPGKSSSHLVRFWHGHVSDLWSVSESVSD